MGYFYIFFIASMPKSNFDVRHFIVCHIIFIMNIQNILIFSFEDILFYFTAYFY
jgi:hypothetical protein